jgi:hypothetical protein
MPHKDPEQRRQYQRDYYNGREPEYRIGIRANVKSRKGALKEIIREAKEGRHCKCGEGHPACLDFHHRESNKVLGIAEIPKAGWSKERLLAEIAKCDLICANCHRKHHFDGP